MGLTWSAAEGADVVLIVLDAALVAGGVLLGLIVTFACLKTSIGLVTSCSETFERMFPKALPYKAWAIIFTVFSFVVSNFGLSKIIEYSVPVLMFLYPLAITLIVLALCGNAFKHDKTVYVSVTAFTFAAAIFDLLKTLPAGLQENMHLAPAIGFARNVLPWFDLNLGWVVPAVIGLAVGLVIRKFKK